MTETKAAHTSLKFYRSHQLPGDACREPVVIDFREITDEGQHIGNVGKVHPKFAELVVSAPSLQQQRDELLEACQATVELWEQDAEAKTPGTDAFLWLYQARTAIANATEGGSESHGY